MSTIVTTEGASKSVFTILNTTSSTAVYTVPTTGVSASRIVTLRLTNVDTGTAVDVTVTIQDGPTAYTYCALHTLPAQDSVEFDFRLMRLDSGKSVKVTASVGGVIHAFLTAIEARR